MPYSSLKRYCCPLLILAGIPAVGYTQVTAQPVVLQTAVQATDLDSINTALKERHAIALAVASGKEKAPLALARLKAMRLPAWAQGNQDADFGDAALDVGNRLLAADRADVAILFFKAAEQSLLTALKNSPVGETQRKVDYLRRLALLRAKYLGNPIPAMADLNDALKLLPDDPQLLADRENLRRDNAAIFNTAP